MPPVQQPAQPADVAISVTSVATPPPPISGPLKVYGFRMPFNVIKLNALGHLAFGVTMCAMAIVGLITLIFNPMTLFASLLLIFMGVLLAWISLRPSAYIAKYFGFLQYPVGSGAALIYTGCLQLGIAGAGVVVGAITITWGVLSVLLHFGVRGQGLAVNAHLLSRG